MKKYRGKYRVLIERDIYGEPLKDGFTYLKCGGNNRSGKVYRYNDDILVAHVIGVRKAENMIKEIREKGINIEIVYYYGEVDIKFPEISLDDISNILNVSTFGKDISWSSIKNHPRYKEIKEEKYDKLSEEEKLRRYESGNKLRELSLMGNNIDEKS